MRTTDLYWLAGLLEGEGCFTEYKKDHTPVLMVGMTDKDVIDRVAKLLGINWHYMRVKAGHKPCYYVRLTHRKAIQWMMTLYTLLGSRRQARIREIITSWKQRQSKYDSYTRSKVAARRTRNQQGQFVSAAN